MKVGSLCYLVVVALLGSVYFVPAAAFVSRRKDSDLDR